MEFAGSKRPKFACRIFLNGGAKFFRESRWPEACKCQMWRERPLLGREPKSFGGLADIRGKCFQVRRRVHPGPENPRIFFIREETQAMKIDRYLSIAMHRGERHTNSAQFVRGNLPD